MKSKRESPIDRRLKLFLLVAITVLAAFFRLHRIDQLPPGDRYDPAFYGIDALRVLRGEHPIFFYDYVGQHRVEPLFSYLVALCFLVVGPSTLGIHLTSALVGIVTVPAVYVAAETMFADEESPLRRWGGLLAALMMALSYWHLNWSRYGVRAILVPPFAALALYFLWRGLHEGRRWLFVACGAVLGMSAYTYQAARLLPVLVIVAFAAVAWRRGSISRRDWTDALIVAGVALLVFAPLGVYFASHPDAFSARIEEVLIVDDGEDLKGCARSLWGQVRAAGLSYVVGSDYAPFRTLPGRPSLNPLFSALFLLGIGLSAARIKRPVYLLLLTWLLVMTIPAMLAGGGSEAKRAIGALPAVAMLIAVAVVAPLQIIHRWSLGPVRRRALQATCALALIGTFAYGGWATYRDYFVRWGSNPNLFTHFEGGRAAIGDYAGALPPDEQIYISPDVPSHPVIRFHAGLREGIQGYNGRVCLVIPERVEANTTYILGSLPGEQSLDLLERYLPAGEVVAKGGWHRGEPYFLAYRIPAGVEADVTPAHPISARWRNGIQLLGYDLGAGAPAPGEAVELTLYYRAEEAVDQRYTAFVHLLGMHDPATDSPLWAQNDSEPCHTFYPTSSWAAGEIIVDRITLRIPDDVPSGTYDLAMGFYEAWSGNRLPATGSAVTEHDVVMLRQVSVTSSK
jgi:4-amino-4-deoxy-L-arabinose transferase-like glycosyltransferase